MEEDETQEVTPTEGQEQERPQLTYEELQAELAKTRREAAGKRVANKELESELDAFRKWKESQMTELEKAQSRLADVDKERFADYVEIAQGKFGLEDEDLEFLKGTTKAEILASAEKLAQRLGRTQSEEDQTPRGNPNLFPGLRGKPVGSGANDPNARLRDQLLGRSS